MAPLQQQEQIEESRADSTSEASWRQDVEEFVYEHGSFPDSYIVTEPDYQHFWNRQRTGLVGYIQDGRYLHVVGGLIAPDDEKEALLEEFLSFASARNHHVSFFSIPDHELSLFQRHGFQTTKFGEDALISLPGHNWKGSRYSWVRRQVSFVKRSGIIAREIDLESLNDRQRVEMFDKLQAMNEAQLSDRVLNHEIGLLEGKLYPDFFYRRRLFVAHPEGQPEPEHWQAFVACTPMKGGEGWATEMYRNTAESVRGVLPCLFVHLIDKMQAEGVQRVSLCMVPGIHCGKKHPDDSARTRHFLRLWEKRLNFLFNVHGLYHFKSRFRPEFEPVFLCVKPKVTTMSTLSFLRCVGVFKLSWKNLWRHVRQSRQK